MRIYYRPWPSVASELTMKLRRMWVCVFVHMCLCVCVIAVRDTESSWAVWELGASSRGVAWHPDPFAACHVLCLGFKSRSVVLSLKIIGVTGRHLGMKEGCNLCLSYTDRAHWCYRVTVGCGRSQSLSHSVHQPEEYSDYILSAETATQSANLFQSSQCFGGGMSTCLRGTGLRYHPFSLQIVRQTLTDGTGFQPQFADGYGLLTCE